MADITAIISIMVFLGIAYPGLLASLWLLFPNPVRRARLRLERSPWNCFWLGLGLTIIWSIPAAVLIALPIGPIKLVGWLLIILLLGLGSLGAAGLSVKMGLALSRKQDFPNPDPGAFLGGAIALELAAAFPIIGWFLFFPLSTMITLGASAFAILNWMPADKLLREPDLAQPVNQRPQPADSTSVEKAPRGVDSSQMGEISP